MIGIFGGTFDPVHHGHLRAVIEAGEIFKLDEVRLIPNKTPPHRGEPSVTSAMRLEMLRLATEKLPNLVIDTRELDREGPSYMVDTLRSLRSDFAERPLLLFIGVDAFNGLTRWHRWAELFDHAHIVVLTRPGYLIQLENEFFRGREVLQTAELTRHQAGKLMFQRITELDISASAIRKIIAEQRDPRFLLPDVVIDYIHSHRLYQNF